MKQRIPAVVPTPGEIISDELDARGWTQTHLARLMGRPVQVVNEIIHARKQITPETAIQLADALQTSPELWLNLESSYRLWKAQEARATTEMS